MQSEQSDEPAAPPRPRKRLRKGCEMIADDHDGCVDLDEFLKYLSAAWVRHFSATSVFELEEDERNRSALVGRRSGRSKRGSGESEEEESWVGLAAARSQPTNERASVAKSVDFAESSKGRDGGTLKSIRLSLMRTWG